ncbi:hypothetical protein GCM10007972_13650 [Iodidimonas muriae]|uniref:TonB C-terminal domain-containing protein n=1 Tax=Iodidimonas muriae TaxID=261467 RepID=A0ABQ2LCJ8_9PROT|nr:TonB family protein [Iodidimonas muriae]GER07406.1 hypothetical protein JCM17843_17160 [Kordiimonadales bacterium JCM 17843]GGO10620.1 hypothetical protein GCM10007972_13650 [Iodidimonas muriae]
MTIRKFVLSTAGAALALTLGAAAQAGEALDLTHWKAECSKLISWKMDYPTITKRLTLPDAHAVVDLRINRDGEVLGWELARSSGHAYFDRSSRKLGKNLEKLPALPTSYRADYAQVRVHLLYSETQRGINKMLDTVVRMEQVAKEGDVDADNQLADSGEMRISLISGAS